METIKSLLIGVLTFMATSVFAQTKTDSFKVYGNCEMCKNRIEKATNHEGIVSAVWGVDTKVMIVIYDTMKITNNDIQKKIAFVGHDTDKYMADDKVYNELPGCCQYDRKKTDKQEDHSNHRH